jgi:hypothetical protein
MRAPQHLPVVTILFLLHDNAMQCNAMAWQWRGNGVAMAWQSVEKRPSIGMCTQRLHSIRDIGAATATHARKYADTENNKLIQYHTTTMLLTRCIHMAVGRPLTTRLPSLATPTITNTTRNYNKRSYKLQKRAERALKHQDDITFTDCVHILRSYSLGQPSMPLLASLQLAPDVVGLDAVASASATANATTATTPTIKTFKGQVTLPHPLSVASDNTKSPSENTILVFAKGPQAQIAKDMGAHIVGGEELIPDILAGKLQFTRCLATKPMFPHVVKIAKFLGPKGLMPSPGKGTVSDDVVAMMKSLAASTPFVSDGQGRVVVEVGRVSWEPAKLQGVSFHLFVFLANPLQPCHSLTH